ncbi:hypothetical protein GCM10009555_053910 [Acrocarpospora macrocephala]|uniref:Type ISP restriction-modification enzyme LLaBIII C-terminal specificity domain-containing protein n=1 Tax=Acrocarpospora macrocephala TaxID=150177 RepID=A0A5M3WRF8_9ACTN|nr:type ISP restriction/modification enzyme [Acrocarpospora macrocephala]GES11086.1 hypothetical protein Amac_046830 [Acrocarpospora macrocephala]
MVRPFTRLDHFCSWGGGEVRPLWRDSTCSAPNMTKEIFSHLSGALGISTSPEDVLAYIAAVTSHPAFTRRFQKQL